MNESSVYTTSAIFVSCLVFTHMTDYWLSKQQEILKLSTVWFKYSHTDVLCVFILRLSGNL